MCTTHWDALKGAIEVRGMGHLIAANARDAHARAVSEVKGASEVDDFDPLMAATWMIYGRATNDFGLVMMTLDEQGAHRCPLCELLKHTPPPAVGHRYATNEAYFIDGPADATLVEAIARGLASPVTLGETDQ